MTGISVAAMRKPVQLAARADLDTKLTSVGVAQPGHDGPMERVRGETSSRRRGIHGALANKHAADSRARALALTLRELIAAGFASRLALADELNRRGIPTSRGGIWHYTTVARMLTRAGLTTNGRINNGQARKQAADARAKALAQTIRALQAKGLVSASAITRELNEREIPTALGGKWYQASVDRLLQRLERLDQASNSRHRR